MNDEEYKSKTNYIFYLKLAKDLPDYYFYLAEMFLLYDTTLIPVTIKEFKDLMSPDKQNVLILSTTFEERRNLIKYQSLYIDHAILRNLITIFDLSSFTALKNQGIEIRRKNYQFIPLPMTLAQVVSRICLSIQKEKTIIKTWPGGRRPRLPKLLQGA